ncbi:MAG: hypothetical protein SVZ03_02430 [Spirochaetota bacterium]|nr:hypothetical protein [Spirochaetota bacterium]
MNASVDMDGLSANIADVTVTATSVQDNTKSHSIDIKIEKRYYVISINNTADSDPSDLVS